MKKIILIISLFIVIAGGTVAAFALTLKKTVESEPTFQRQDYPAEIQPENRAPRFLNGNTNSSWRAGDPSLGFGADDEDLCARFNNQGMMNVNRALPANINASGFRPAGMEAIQEKISEICADNVVTDEEKLKLENLQPQNDSLPGPPNSNLNLNNN